MNDMRRMVQAKMLNRTVQVFRVALVLILGAVLSGCLAAKAVGTAADVTIGVTKGVVKTGAMVVGAAIPDGDDEEDEDEDEDED